MTSSNILQSKSNYNDMSFQQRMALLENMDNMKLAARSAMHMPPPMFCLMTQPDSNQRKSYNKEKRYITPRPLTLKAMSIITSDQLKKRLFATVELISMEGTSAHSWTPVKGLSGELEASWNPRDTTIEFNELYISELHEKKVGFKFTVKEIIVTNGVNKTEVAQVVYSRPFYVTSNTRKKSKRDTTESATKKPARKKRMLSQDSDTSITTTTIDTNSDDTITTPTTYESVTWEV
jgi:hypothetical protein